MLSSLKDVKYASHVPNCRFSPPFRTVFLGIFKIGIFDFQKPAKGRTKAVSVAFLIYLGTKC